MFTPDLRSILTDIAPFYLLPNYKKPWLCPVTAFGNWIQHMTLYKHANFSGFVFRKKSKSPYKTSDDADDKMVCPPVLLIITIILFNYIYWYYIGLSILS
jgi:hypothetical protein